MKQIFKYGLSLCTMLLFAAACQMEEQLDPSQGGEGLQEDQFVILLDPASKTINNGLSSLWVNGDKVNVFHAEAGSDVYVNDGAFEYSGGNEFRGVLAEDLKSGKSYDWYVSYPYDANMTSPKAMKISIPSVQSQSEDGSTAHLCGSLCPLAGKKKGVAAGTSPSVGMQHLVTVMKIKVTNYEASPCMLETVSFCHKDLKGVKTALTGNFIVDFSGDAATYAPELPTTPTVGIDGW